MLNPGKRIEGRSSLSCGASQEVFESNIFTLFFSVGWKTTDGLWNPVIVNVTELLRHYLPSFHASRPWCAAVEEGGGELENITGPSP